MVKYAHWSAVNATTHSMSEGNLSLREIFNETVEIVDAQQRRTYLAEACGAEPELFGHVFPLRVV